MFELIATAPAMDWEALGIKGGTATALIFGGLAVFHNYAKKFLDERDAREKELIALRKEGQQMLIDGMKETAARFERAADRIEAAAERLCNTNLTQRSP